MDFEKDSKGRIKNIKYFRSFFINQVGKPDIYNKVDEGFIAKYRNTLPEELLHYWTTYGFSSFKNGLLWLTNPEDYFELVKNYLKGTPFENRPNLYVVARSAFGELLIWESTKGNTLKLQSMSNMIFLSADADREDFKTEEENFAMNRFLSFDPDHFDQDDARGNYLFERALKKIGKVEENEMYGYKLSHFLGGKESITNLTKMDLFNHYDIQKELKEPTVSVSDMENNTVTY